MKEKELDLSHNEDAIGNLNAALTKLNSGDHSFKPEEVKRLRDFEKSIVQSRKDFSDVMSKFADRIDQGLQELRKVISKIAEESLQNISNISKVGWYISPNITESWGFYDIRILSIEKNLESFENQILDSSNEQVEKILNRTKILFPSRSTIIDEIMSLYDNGLYHGLIALCYSQIDGICNERFGFGFFDKDSDQNYQLRTLTEFEQFDQSLTPYFVRQLSITENEMTMHSQNKVFNDPEKKAKSYNRHLIMHGHSYNYGTYKNAIRAIYALDFLCYFIELSES